MCLSGWLLATPPRKDRVVLRFRDGLITDRGHLLVLWKQLQFWLLAWFQVLLSSKSKTRLGEFVNEISSSFFCYPAKECEKYPCMILGLNLVSMLNFSQVLLQGISHLKDNEKICFLGDVSDTSVNCDSSCL